MKKIPGLICLLAVASLAAAQPVSTNAAFTPRELQIIAAAKPGPKPCFNGASVIGVRPNMPVLYALTVSGTRPLDFSAKQLPAGLTLDSKTGIITGTLAEKGEFMFTASAKNSVGKGEAQIKIICGDAIALTPPMGWNSYDAFGDNVAESEVLANARYVAEKMLPLGWDTVVVDYCWSDPGAHDNNRNPRANAPGAMDKFGRMIPGSTLFPYAMNGVAFRMLAYAIHAHGLKLGIH